MAYLILPSMWRQQPQYPVRLSRALGSLNAVYTLGSLLYNASTGVPVGLDSNFSPIITTAGFALDPIANSVSHDSGFKAGNWYSALFLFKVGTANIDAGSNDSPLFQNSSVGSGVGVRSGSVTGFLTNETITILDGGTGRTGIFDTLVVGVHTLVVHWTGSKYEFWLDGVRPNQSDGTGGACSLLNANVYLGGRAFSATPHISPILFALDNTGSIDLRQYKSAPFEILSPPQRRIYVSLPAGGTTVALTGQATTASQGSLGVSVSAALTGQTTTSAQGTLTPTVGVVVPLAGQATTAGQGQLGVAVDTALAGQSTSATQGSLAAAVAVAVVGQSVTGNQGALSVSVTVPLIGQSTTASQGSVGIGGNIVVALAGQSTLTQLGVLTPVGGNVAARGPLTDGDERKRKRPHRQQVREALIEAFEGPYREEAKEIAAKHVPFAEVSIDTVQLDKFARDLEAVERMMTLVKKQRDEEDEDILLMMIQ